MTLAAAFDLSGYRYLTVDRAISQSDVIYQSSKLLLGTSSTMLPSTSRELVALMTSCPSLLPVSFIVYDIPLSPV